MGFKKGAYATIWSVRPETDTRVTLKISTSRKLASGEYETDFSGFISAVGGDCAKKAAALKEKDRIKIGDVDVFNKYEKEKQTTYYNCKMFNFEMADGSGKTETKRVDDGEIDKEPEPKSDSRLPF